MLTLVVGQNKKRNRCKEMNKEGTKIIGDGVLVFWWSWKWPYCRTPKFIKRNGYYYILHLRRCYHRLAVGSAKQNVYGPYERRVVMAGSRQNGYIRALGLPHKTAKTGFFTFRDKGALGVCGASATHEMDERLASDRDWQNGKNWRTRLLFIKNRMWEKIAVQTPPDTDEFDK